MNCGPWNQTDFIYYMPGFPDCPITISYEVKICYDQAYFRMLAISYEVTPDCAGVQDILVPGGLITNPIACAQLWRDAFTALSMNFFNYLHNQNPTLYNCPSSYMCTSVTPGGCNSWISAYRGPYGTHPYGWEIIKKVPCESFGCCLNVRRYCYDTVLQQTKLLSETNQFIASPDCDKKVPLYNPFEGLGPEWRISPPTPCALSCYTF